MFIFKYLLLPKVYKNAVNAALESLYKTFQEDKKMHENIEQNKTSEKIF